MSHTCLWPTEEGVCGELAHHCVELELVGLEGESIWLCTEHYDFVTGLIKDIAHWDDPIGDQMLKIVRKNKL
jgi:hypothetical protein